MLQISIVTFNRRDILRRCLDALQRHTQEPVHIHVSDNGSKDGTAAMLTQYQAENPGLLSLYLLPENVGLARARNAHFQHCIGVDCVRLDDKILVQSPYWSNILRAQAYRYHVLTAFTDPDTAPLWRYVEQVEVAEYPLWMCGASLFVPAEVSKALGAWDEFSWPDGSPLLYGWEDLGYMLRAEQLGWPFRYSLRAHALFMARAGAETRARAMEFEATYNEVKRQYQEGERDLFIDISQTEGYRLGQSVPVSSLVSVGAAMELAYP